MKNLFSTFASNKIFVALVVFYFLTRLVNLTNFPIFNDEAIYLDWGWRETHIPGFLYYSLYDAKQPLLMWVFGIMQQLLPDPLFAGRIVSVFAGFLTFLGIYKISRKLFDTKTAILSSFTYILIPLFSFYDRQALMESSISAVGIWAGYFLLTILEKKYYKYAVFLGLIFGVGFFIKSSALVFLAAFTFSTVFLIKISSRKGRYIEMLTLTALVFFSSIVLLIINPQFWNSLESNTRFTLTIGEFFSLPVNIWLSTFIINLKVSFFYLTPIVFISSLIGAVYIFKKNSMHKLFLLYFFLSLLISTFVIRGASDRYIISFLPFLVICSSHFLIEVFNKNRINGYFIIFISLIFPLFLVFYQTINFPGYIQLMGKISGYEHTAYLKGFTSGYGVNEAIKYFNDLSKKEKFIIGTAENTGNPESAFHIYFNKNKNVRVAYMDSKLLNVDINNYDCLLTGNKTYFISRDNQQAGLERFFEKITEIKNPYGNNFIGIYTLKKNCKGKALEISAKQN